MLTIGANRVWFESAGLSFSSGWKDAEGFPYGVRPPAEVEKADAWIAARLAVAGVGAGAAAAHSEL